MDDMHDIHVLSEPNGAADIHSKKQDVVMTELEVESSSQATDYDTLIKTLENVDRLSFDGNDTARLRAMSAARSLYQKLETPWEATNRIVTQEPSLHMALKLAVDMSLFTHLGAPVSSPRSTVSLSTATMIDITLLRRILRHLAAMNVIAEVGPDSWSATDFSASLSTPTGSAAVRNLLAQYYPVYAGMPHFLLQNGYKSPSDSRNGAFQYSIGQPGQNHYEYLALAEHRQHAEALNDFMSFMTSHRPSWMDVYDEVDSLVDPTAHQPEVPLFVDIGGGLGEDVRVFRRAFPLSRYPGRVVLQDLPYIATQVSSGASGLDMERNGIEIQAHDMFTEQPPSTCGARIYYMSGVMHNWPDEDARKILQNVNKAMSDDSVLLLNESVVPEVHCAPQLSGVDITMMAMLSGKERTEKDWRDLFRATGLEIKRIVGKEFSFKRVIECRKA